MLKQFITNHTQMTYYRSHSLGFLNLRAFLLLTFSLLNFIKELRIFMPPFYYFKVRILCEIWSFPLLYCNFNSKRSPTQCTFNSIQYQNSWGSQCLLVIILARLHWGATGQAGTKLLYKCNSFFINYLSQPLDWMVS
jgi:hypothetical protein